MKNRIKFDRFAGLLLLLTLLFSGCSTLENLFWNEMKGDASEEADNAAESRIAAETEAEDTTDDESSMSGLKVGSSQWNQIMTTRSQMAFNYAFSAGGMWAGNAEYKPGEFTMFNWVMDRDETIVLERAYLKRLNDGNQWWRVSWEESDELWIWEALIEPDSGQILRMRARGPDGSDGEVPVSGQRVYMPAELTRESIQGATVDSGKVNVPAGRFQADHVVYVIPEGNGQVEFWLVPQIPGGVAKYMISEKDKGIIWNSELLDFGKQATTRLNSF